MSRLTMQARRNLPKSAFAIPSKAPGSGSYPIPDAAHAKAAIGLAAMHHAGPAVQAAVHHKAKTKGVGQKLGSGSHGFMHHGAKKY